MSEQTGALLFLGALVAVYPLTLLVAQAMWRRDMARDAQERAHGVEVADE